MSEQTPSISKTVVSASNAGIVWGILTILIGFFAIASPLISGLAVSIMAAVSLIAAGIAQTIYAFQAGSLGRGILRLLFGGLTVIAGVVMVAQPGLALATLTLVLAVYFFADGLVTIVTSISLRPAQGWGWMLFNGVVTLALGLMILRDWPVSGVWAIGILVGIRLIFSGMTMLSLGIAGREVAGTAQNREL